MTGREGLVRKTGCWHVTESWAAGVLPLEVTLIRHPGRESAFEQAAEALRRTGFRSYTVYRGRKPVDIPI